MKVECIVSESQWKVSDDFKNAPRPKKGEICYVIGERNGEYYKLAEYEPFFYAKENFREVKDDSDFIEISFKKIKEVLPKQSVN